MKEASPVRRSCQKWIIRPPDLVPVERKIQGGKEEANATSGKQGNQFHGKL